MNTRPPLPPFTRESAIEKVRLAEDGWNSRDAAKVALAYSLDTQWRNRAEFANNREEAQAFLERKWKKELDYRLIKSFGHSQKTGSRFATPMNGMMIQATGSVRTAMKTGSSIRTD
jgi:nuclear transport factor 2 (NTF2) superfamily protein